MIIIIIVTNFSIAEIFCFSIILFFVLESLLSMILTSGLDFVSREGIQNLGFIFVLTRKS